MADHSKPSTLEAITKLKEEGYTIYASDLTPDSVDIRDLKWDSDDGRQKVCVVMGNEMKGISDEMRGLVDGTFTIPMSGMAESFNLSAATAITLAHMSANSDRDGTRGPLRPGDLSQHERNCMRLKWLLNSLPQHRMGEALLRKKGLELPKEFRKYF